MKVVLLCNEQYNQVALANKIAGNFELAGIVIERPVHKKKKTFSHGLNNNGSCIEKIIASAKMPANQNRFLALRDREMNGTFKKSY